MVSSGDLFPADVRDVVRHYWKVARGRPIHLAIPIALAFVASAFEGLSFALLVPLSDAASNNSFDGLDDSLLFGWAFRVLPESGLASPDRDAYLVALLLGMVVLLRALKLGVDYARTTYVAWREEEYLVRVNEDTFARVLRFGRQYFESRALGRMDVEIRWTREVVHLLGQAERFLTGVLGILAKGVVLVVLSVPLALSMIVGIPTIQWTLRRLSHRIQRLAGEDAECERAVRSRALDLLASVALVKSFGQERRATEEYSDLLEEARSKKVRLRATRAVRWPAEEMLVLGFVIGTQLVIVFLAESFGPGDLARTAAVLLLVAKILPDLREVSRFAVALAERRPKLEALASFLDPEGKFKVPSGDRPFTGLREAVQIRDLSFGYLPGVPVIREVSATVQAGQTIAIVGGSGSGKSTFVNLLARFYDHDAGSIEVDGTDIREFSLESLYRRVGIVSQEVWLLNRTLRENLTYGLDDPPEDRELIEILHSVALEDLVAEYPDVLGRVVGDRGVQLSGGQRQRVALARVLLRDQDLVIMDEATSALDSVTESRVVEAVRGRTDDRTLLVVAHRLSTVRDADEIWVFKGGRIVERGTWEELLRRGDEFARLHGAQFTGVPAVSGT